MVVSRSATGAAPNAAFSAGAEPDSFVEDSGEEVGVCSDGSIALHRVVVY
jgi:hypothetical protein